MDMAEVVVDEGLIIDRVLALSEIRTAYNVNLTIDSLPISSRAIATLARGKTASHRQAVSCPTKFRYAHTWDVQHRRSKDQGS